MQAGFEKFEFLSQLGYRTCHEILVRRGILTMRLRWVELLMFILQNPGLR